MSYSTRSFALVLLVVLFGARADSVVAGVIRGTLVVPTRSEASPPAMNPYPGRASSMTGVQPRTRGLATDAVVYVDQVPARAESVLAASRAPVPRLAQKDQAFVPRVLAIAVGTRVDFPNLDPIYHNVFSLSPVRRFDLGKYPRGDSRQVVFQKPGLVNVYCDIHTDMEAFVLVLPHHGFTRPDASGEFALPDLPAGRYVVKVWHPDLGEKSATVDVPARGGVTVPLGF